MTELKTLKDIQIIGPDGVEDSEYVKGLLRAEAVKWVKSKQFNQREPLDAEDWKRFFNLTPEDLQEEKK